MIRKKIPCEDTQFKESLWNLSNGNYRDYPIEEYIKRVGGSSK